MIFGLADLNFAYKVLAPIERHFRKYVVGAGLVQLQFACDAAGLDALLLSQNNQLITSNAVLGTGNTFTNIILPPTHVTERWNARNTAAYFD